MSKPYSAWVRITVENFPADDDGAAHRTFHEFVNELVAWLNGSKDGKESELQIKEIEYPMVLPATEPPKKREVFSNWVE